MKQTKCGAASVIELHQTTSILLQKPTSGDLSRLKGEELKFVLSYTSPLKAYSLAQHI